MFKNIKVQTQTCIKVFANLSTTNPSFLQTYKNPNDQIKAKNKKGNV
jgi:hypothetical protein